jgi:hypothetical protein
LWPIFDELVKSPQVVIPAQAGMTKHGFPDFLRCHHNISLTYKAEIIIVRSWTSNVLSKGDKMKKVILRSLCVAFVLFFISGAVSAQTAGLQTGVAVKIVKKDGNSFEGKLVKTTATEFLINTTKGLRVNKYLKDIKKITDTGKSDAGRTVHEYVLINDQSFQGVWWGGMGMIFDIDLGTYGIQKISIESLNSIEVIEAGSGQGEQDCVVNCPHCGKPIKVKVSK